MNLENASSLAGPAEALPTSSGPEFIGPAAITPDLRQAIYQNGVKRAMDVTITVLAAPVWAVVTLLLALLVMTDGHSPFFCQKRIGRGGRIYRMWKLRSMVPNADAALANLLASDPEAKAEWERDQKLKNDPRITPIGRLIRACSLDELPQFWNVLRGDMSLVGPRPMMIDQAELYPGQSYYALRPGITGPWQVSARNETSFAARARFDDEYLRSHSLSRDIALLFATVGVVLRGTGY